MLQCWDCKTQLDEETGYHLVDGDATCCDCAG